MRLHSKKKKDTEDLSQNKHAYKASNDMSHFKDHSKEIHPSPTRGYKINVIQKIKSPGDSIKKEKKFASYQRHELHPFSIEGNYSSNSHHNNGPDLLNNLQSSRENSHHRHHHEKIKITLKSHLKPRKPIKELEMKSS